MRWQPRKGGRRHLRKTRRNVFPLDCSEFVLRTFGANFWHIGSGIAVLLSFFWKPPLWRCTLRCQSRKVGDNIYAKGDARFSHWIALHFVCTRLELVFEIQEVELQCGFSLYESCLSGDVHWGGNLEKVGDNIYAKRGARFSHWIALRFVCARLSSIFDIPEVELECSISVFWLILSGNVHVTYVET